MIKFHKKGVIEYYTNGVLSDEYRTYFKSFLDSDDTIYNIDIKYICTIRLNRKHEDYELELKIGESKLITLSPDPVVPFENIDYPGGSIHAYNIYKRIN